MQITGKRFLGSLNIAFFLTLLAFGLAGVILLRYITPYGLGLVNDSVGYIAGARNLASGAGYTRLTGDARHVPITNYPPMYPLVMSLINRLTGLEVIRAARLLNLLCFAANIVLCGIITCLLTGSQLLGILAALLLLLSEPFLLIHAYALSEPLYLLFSLIMLSSLVLYARQRSQPWQQQSGLFLAAAGIFACLGYLTRYPGVALYATAFLIIFIIGHSWKERVLDSAVFLAAGLPGVLAWSVHNAVVSGNPANRAFSYHLIPWDKVIEGLHSLWSFLIPDRWVTAGMPGSAVAWLVAALLLFGTLVYLLIAISLKMMKNAHPPVTLGELGVLVFGAHAFLYLLVLVLTLTFLDASPIFEHRILSPVYISLLLLVPLLVCWLYRKTAWGIAVSLLLGLALLASFTLDSLPTIREFHEYGQGYISLRWQRSSVVEVARELPPVTLFSNKTQALYLLADRPAYVLVSPFNPATQSDRPDYDATLETIRQMVLDGKAVLVIFDYQELILQPENAWLVELTRGLPVYGYYWDGTIFCIAAQ